MKRLVTKCCGIGLTYADDATSVTCPQHGFEQLAVRSQGTASFSIVGVRQTADFSFLTQKPPEKKWVVHEGPAASHWSDVDCGWCFREGMERAAKIVAEKTDMIEHSSGARHKADRLCGECYLELREIIKTNQSRFVDKVIGEIGQQPEPKAPEVRIIGPEE